MVSASGRRVSWRCGTKPCSKGVHYGTVIDISRADALAGGLTPELDQPLNVAVVLDDRPGVIQYHSWAELSDA